MQRRAEGRTHPLQQQSEPLTCGYIARHTHQPRARPTTKLNAGLKAVRTHYSRVNHSLEVVQHGTPIGQGQAYN